MAFADSALAGAAIVQPDLCHRTQVTGLRAQTPRARPQRLRLKQSMAWRGSVMATSVPQSFREGGNTGGSSSADMATASLDLGNDVPTKLAVQSARMQDLEKKIRGAVQLANWVTRELSVREAASARSRDRIPAMAEFSSEDASCVVRNPGSMMCTTQRVDADLASRSVVLTIQASLRSFGELLQGVPLPPNMSQEIADAAHAVKVSATKLARKHAAPAAGHKEPRDAHAELVHLLAHGRVVAKEGPFSPLDGERYAGRMFYRVTLEDPGTQRRVPALFFLPWSIQDGWSRAPCGHLVQELLAYELNLALGMDAVPPVARRTGVQLQDEFFEEGVFVYSIHNEQPLDQIPPNERLFHAEKLACDAWVLDVLLNNPARSPASFQLCTHWAFDMGMQLPVLSDTRGSLKAPFSQDLANFMHNREAFGVKPLVAMSTYIHLRFLDWSPLRASFVGTGLVSSSEFDGMVARQQFLLQFLDGAVRSQGIRDCMLDRANDLCPC
eukprot:jgi/Mesvir1/24365/Mv11038-RA.1